QVRPRAVLLLDRDPKQAEDELVLTRAHRGGARFVANDRWAAPSPGLDRSWSTVSLGDARAAADALVAALDDAATLGPPGPFGALGLFEEPR
ncbi:MAG: hypothetical protein KDA94_15830, partial [Acidimicrobiales bacterium]|nr:hypothetical protein [Acidimicrobiales bacterium]